MVEHVLTRVDSFPFAHPTRVFYNPHDVKEIWVTTFGNGMYVGRTDHPFDVNGDGIVSPLDVLLIINEINRRGPRQLPPLSADNQHLHRLDVSKDGVLSALDALLVIHYLNQRNDGRAALAEIHSRNPEDSELLDVYSSALMGLGNSFHSRAEWDEADALFDKAARLRHQLKEILDTEAGRSWLKEQLPAIRERLHHVDRLSANAIKNRGDVQLDRWNRTPPHAKEYSSWKQARTSMEKTRTILLELASSAPEIPDVEQDLAKMEYSLGRCYWVLGRSRPPGGKAWEMPQEDVLSRAETHLSSAVSRLVNLTRYMVRNKAVHLLPYLGFCTLPRTASS